MNEIHFQYRKSPTDVTLRKAAVLAKPTNNYFTLDTTELNSEEHEELMEGLAALQLNIEEAFNARTSWIKDKGFGSYYRSFSKDKMDMIAD